MQPPGGVDQQHIDLFFARAFEGLEGDAGRIGANFFGDDFGTHARPPHFELIDGGGAERVGGGEHDAQTLALELMSHLGRGGGLAGAVHPDHQEHMRAGVRHERKVARHRLEHAGNFGGDDVAQRIGVEPPLVAASGDDRADAPGHGHAEIGLDQHLFDAVERVLIELPLGQHAGEIIGQRIGGPGEAVAELIEPAPRRLQPWLGLPLTRSVGGSSSGDGAPGALAGPAGGGAGFRVDAFLSVLSDAG